MARLIKYKSKKGVFIELATYLLLASVYSYVFDLTFKIKLFAIDFSKTGALENFVYDVLQIWLPLIGWKCLFSFTSGFLKCVGIIMITNSGIDMLDLVFTGSTQFWPSTTLINTAIVIALAVSWIIHQNE